MKSQHLWAWDDKDLVEGNGNAQRDKDEIDIFRERTINFLNDQYKVRELRNQ